MGKDLCPGMELTPRHGDVGEFALRVRATLCFDDEAAYGAGSSRKRLLQSKYVD